MDRHIALRVVVIVLLFAGAAETPSRITILYDSSGKAPAVIRVLTKLHLAQPLPLPQQS